MDLNLSPEDRAFRDQARRWFSANVPRTELKKLNLGYTTIIAGHWSPIHGPELVDQYLQLLALNQTQSKDP